MPKRMLDDSLLTSTSLARCSPRAQDAFPRFILLCDDFGCFEVIPRRVVATGWVYRQDVTEADVVAWLEEYVGAGMACLWTENERTYCYLTGWDGEHGQRKRVEYDPGAAKGTREAHGSKRRTPRPPADLVEAVKAGARRDRDGKPPGTAVLPPGSVDPEKPSDSVPAREIAGSAREIRGSAASVAVPVPVPVPDAPARSPSVSSPPASPVVANLPVVGGGVSEVPVTEGDLEPIAAAYPGVDVRGEVLKARAWLLANPAKRKTPRGVLRFLTGWCERAQNGRARGPAPPRRPEDRPAPPLPML